jgi:tetratricopeptide (TPR) repeat protein
VTRATASLAVLLIGGCGAFGAATDEIALDRLAEAHERYDAGRLAEAEPLYAEVIRVRDRCWEAYLRLADCQERAGRLGDAEATLVRLLSVDAWHEEGLSRTLRLREARGDAAGALGAARKLLELKPKDESLRGAVARLEARAAEETQTR